MSWIMIAPTTQPHYFEYSGMTMILNTPIHYSYFQILVGFSLQFQYALFPSSKLIADINVIWQVDAAKFRIMCALLRDFVAPRALYFPHLCHIIIHFALSMYHWTWVSMELHDGFPPNR